jgi:predicted double-glycine peptidase
MVATSKGIDIQKKVINWDELRNRNVIIQKYDYSCGAAALATLITCYFGEDVSEKKVIELMLKDKTDTENKKILKEGFSLLDLKEAAQKLGYVGGMYRLRVEHLAQLQAPVLVYIEPKGYKHFAVLKGVREDRVYLADPSRGNIRVYIDRFKKQWEGVILAIDKEEISAFRDFLKPPVCIYVCPEVFTTRSLFSRHQ